MDPYYAKYMKYKTKYLQMKKLNLRNQFGDSGNASEYLKILSINTKKTNHFSGWMNLCLLITRILIYD